MASALALSRIIPSGGRTFKQPWRGPRSEKTNASRQDSTNLPPARAILDVGPPAPGTSMAATPTNTLTASIEGPSARSGSDSRESACNAGDLGSIPVLGRSPGEWKGYPLSILAWTIPWTVHEIAVHEIATSDTEQLPLSSSDILTRSSKTRTERLHLDLAT